MSRWYVMANPQAPADDTPGRKIFVTGAAGRIGSDFAQRSHEKYDLTLMVHPEEKVDHIQGCGRVVRCDLADRNRLAELMAGHDTLLHLAANPSPKANWDSLLPDNVVGTYNAFEAARSAGCRGVVYASSCNAVLGYDREQRVRPEDPVSPPNLYGVTKCWGEALGRYMAISEGLAVICIRIGAFAREDRGPKPPRRDPSGIWITAPDLTQLFQHCIDDRRLQFAIVHGLSRNRYNRMEMTETCQLLGFEPEDDLTPELPPKPS